LPKNSTNILFIGAISKGEPPRGGEEYRNQLFVNYLDDNFTLRVVDTLKWKRNPFVLINILFSLYLFRFDKIIISASSLSTYRLIKFIYYFHPKLKNKVIYSVIGGYFPEAIKTGLYNKKYFLNINKILVQGDRLKESLSESGISKNVLVIPNFKPISKIWSSSIISNSSLYKFVFISSIMKDKGVVTIFDAISKLKNEKFLPAFQVDFWGPIESDFKDEFYHLLSLYQNDCRYRGYLNIKGDPDTSYKVLSVYDVMLFPSFYKGEGFPGVILDAYISGLPVIASDWNMNSDLIKNGETGVLVKPNNATDLAEAMTWMMNNNDILREMKLNCNNLAFKYDINVVLDSLLLPII